MKRVSLVAIFVALILGIIIGLALRPGTNKSDPITNKTERTYAVNVWYSGWSGWAQAARALQTMSDKVHGLHIKFGGPVDGDPVKQMEEIDQLIAQGVDGILITATDSKSLAPAISKAHKHGIPIVTFFGDVESNERLSHISAADRSAAQYLAEKVSNELKKKFDSKNPAKVLLCTSKVGIAASDKRVDAVKEVITRTPWLKLVASVTDDNDEAKSAEVITAAWAAHGGLDAIIGVVPRTAIGAMTALKEHGKRPGEVLVTGWDSDQDVLKGIKDGWIWATSTPKIAYMALLGVSILDAKKLGYLDLVKQMTSSNSVALPDTINIEQTFIDRSNVDEYL